MIGKLVAAGAVLALLALALLWSAPGRDVVAVGSDPAGAEMVPAPEPASSLVAPEPDLEVDGPESLAAPEELGAGRTAAVVPAGEPGQLLGVGRDDLRRIPGTVVRVDEDGHRYEDEDGKLRFRVAGRLRLALLKEGSWSVHGRPGEELVPERLVVGDLRVRLTGGRESVRLPEAGPVRLEVEALPGVLVHVLDAETGDPLDGIEVYLRDGTGFEDPRWYGKPSRDGLASPFRLQPFATLKHSTRRNYWIRADGRTWRSLEVDFVEDEEATVELKPAGDLELLGLAELSADAIWYVELRREGNDFAPAVDLRVDAGRERFPVKSIDPGEWKARLTCLPPERKEDGHVHWTSDRTLVDVAPFEIRTGRTTRLHFGNQVPVTDASLPLAGTLRLVPGVHVEDYWIEVLGGHSGRLRLVIRSSELRVTRQDPWSFDWDAGLLEAGRYEVRVCPSFDTATVDLVAPGRNDVHLDAGETGHVTLRVIDSRTNSEWPVLDGLVSRTFDLDDQTGWQQILEEDETEGWISRPRPWKVTRSAASVPFRFSAPLGRIKWRTKLDVAGQVAPTLEILPGENDFTLFLDPEALTREEAIQVVRNAPGAGR